MKDAGAEKKQSRIEKRANEYLLVERLPSGMTEGIWSMTGTPAEFAAWAKAKTAELEVKSLTLEIYKKVAVVNTLMPEPKLQVSVEPAVTRNRKQEEVVK